MIDSAAEPERRLMAAVLQGVVDELHGSASSRAAGYGPATNLRLTRVAVAYVASRDRRWPFSFENLCEALSLDSGRLRNALRIMPVPGTARVAAHNVPNAAGSRHKTSRARKVVPSKRKKASAKKKRARKESPARATKKVGTKRVSAKRAKETSTKARAGKQPGTRKAGGGIAQAVTTGRPALVGIPMGAVTGAVHGAETAVAPEPSPAGTASPDKSGEHTGGEPGR